MLPTLENADMFFTDEDGDDHSLTVSYIYYPGNTGKREAGVSIEPDEPASVDIIHIATLDGKNPEYEVEGYNTATAEDIFTFQILEEKKND